MTVIVTDWASFEQVLPIARKYGVGLEIQEFIDPDTIDQPDDLVRTLNEATKDLPVLSMHGPFAELIPGSWDPLVRQVAAKRFQQAYDIALRIGAEHLIFHSGFLPKTYSRDKWIQNACDFWLDFLKDKQAARLIHVENVYENDFSTLKELVDRVNEACDAELLTVCLDIGHVNANSSRRIEDWINSMGDRIRYTHLHNNGGILDDHWRFDKGTLDIQNVLELLQKYSPNAAWSVETIVDDAEPSLLWLRSNGYL